MDEMPYIDAGGRIYLAKDARLSPESFRAMYPCYGEWLKVKNAVDPQNRYSSSMARRLKIGEGALWAKPY